MASKVTNTSILSSGQSTLTFKDIIVDTKPDPKTGKTTRKLRLIGEPVGYLEYNARKRDYNDLDKDGKAKIKNFPFPDADKRKSITRIGHDNVEECYWYQHGYIGSKKYAQNCIEYNPDDGTFEVKILNKGATVFKPLAEYENGSLDDLADGDEGACTFLGGRTAPLIRVTCHKDTSKPGNVRYEMHVTKKITTISEEEEEALRAIFVPSEEEMQRRKDEYNARRADDPRLPKFEEFFECGHNIQNIFKYTPPLLDDDDDEEDERPSRTKASRDDDDDDDPKSKPKTAKKTMTVDDDDDDEEPKSKSKTTKKTMTVDDDEEEEPNPKSSKKTSDDDDEEDIKPKSGKRNIFEEVDSDGDDWED